MLYAGAKLETAREISRVLEYRKAELDDDNIHESFSQLLNQLKNSSNHLDISNALFASDVTHLLFSYEELLQTKYDAGVQEFNHERNKEAVRDINDWVKEKTKGKINKIVDDISEDTRLLILSVIYFNGIWKNKFNSTTSMGIFYNNGKDGVLVPMMQTIGEFNSFISIDKGIKVLEIPYKDDSISMIIVLPIEFLNLNIIERNIDADELNRILRQMELETVGVNIPKFKLDVSKKLRNQLINLGIRKAFNEKADFSGINGNYDLYVSDVLHKAVMEVNERGSIVTAASNIQLFYHSSTLSVFHANHPFLFYVLGRKTNMILFAGRVQQL
ncbi:intracellular coagulation inhibitor 2-like [Centruroides vittatus]|uniref:intracellular coagulation inhibitor 2-like n=1 Tax=Centruroides vittatus TaxID=120091 RepID=UPI00350EB2E6